MESTDDDPSPEKSARHHNVSIRHMEIDDLAAIFHLGEALFTAKEVPNLHRTWNENEVVAFFQSDWEYCYVAETESGEVVGFALGSLIEKSHSWTYGYLIWMGVRSDYQRTGIAYRLFRQWRLAVMEAGARIIMVDTEADNDAALRFFRRMGFNNSQEHVFLTMNVDQARRKYEERRQEREVRQILEEHERRMNANGKSTTPNQPPPAAKSAPQNGQHLQSAR